MADATNPKPFLPIAFTLAANARSDTFETASGACLYVAEGAAITPGGLSIKLDENEPFRVAVGDFIRVPRFDKLKLFNNLGVSISGVIFVSSYADFLYFNYPRGL